MPTFDDAIDHRLAGASSSPESDSTDHDLDDLATRLAAVERALTDGDTPVADLDDAETLDQRLTALETAVADLTDRVAELEAASSALRGYAAGVRAVNEDVERRADLALAKAETIERSLREDPGLRIERLDASITDEQAADGERRRDGKRGNRRGGRSENRHDDESEKRHASDAEVSAAVGSAAETDDTTQSGESSRRSLSRRLRDAL
jgi:hypothetical protein